MFIQNNIRKYSVDENSDSEQIHLFSLMFPKNDNFPPKETLDMLKLKFNPNLHSNQLINHSYRCHKTHLIDFFNQFKNISNIKLEQPLISNHYSNSCFVDLYQLGRYLEDKTQIYPSIHIGTVPKSFKKIIDNIFTEYGYIPNFQRFLLFYPEYLQKHLTLQKILFDDNHLDGIIAYFLGIIACAELGSIYGLNRMLKKFIKVGGNIEWITKSKYPEKIKKILTLNRLLARSIWKLDSDIIEEILENNYWTEKQLALVIQVLTFSHYFSTIALAIGLNCEQIDNELINFDELIKIKNQYDLIFYESSQGQKLATVIENISRVSSDEQNQKSQKNQRKKELLDMLQMQKKTSGNRKDLKKSLRRSDNQEMIQNFMKEIGNQLNKQQLYFKMHKVIEPLLPKYQVIEKRHEKDFPPQDASDQNFKITAFPILYNLTNDAAQKALDLITYSEIMTNNNFGQSKIDNTKPFRKAIRYYSENLCGYIHFEYNYKNISPLLPIPFKFYIRLLTLSPLHIKKQVLNEVRHVEEGQFNLFDLGHVALITANCKMGLALSCAIHSFEY